MAGMHPFQAVIHDQYCFDIKDYFSYTLHTKNEVLINDNHDGVYYN
jgi:hypothetical protein